MNLLRDIPLLKGTRTYPRQIISDSWQDRDVILSPNVNLFCWRRPVEESISHYLELLLSHTLHPIRCTVHSGNLKKVLLQHREDWDRTYLAQGDLFWQDVLELAQGFLSFSETDTATLHLKVIHDDACSKFHTDGYRLRLFTTYHGKGTEWLPEKALNRAALKKSNALIVKDKTQIRQMGTFHVGILKGEIPSTSLSVKGIVHRSPKVSQWQERRIILRIDL